MPRKTVWLVLKNSDMTEGRGPMVPVVACPTSVTAKKIADYLEPYGYSGQFNGSQEIPFVESVEEFQAANDEKIKREALAKLTPKERELLGL